MRLAFAIVLIVFVASPAFAQRGTQIVIPGKRGVPVYINGVDASWAIVEGEFGLDHPGLVPVKIIYRPMLVSLPGPAPTYYPKSGKKPGYGRLEIIPPANRPLPPPAPTYYRSWSAGSAPGPVTDYAPYYGPDVIGLPGYGGGGYRPGPPRPPGPPGPPGPKPGAPNIPDFPDP